MAIAVPIVAATREGAGIIELAAAHSSTVASEAHVPGPGFSRPIPRKVAIRSAQSGGREAAGAEPPLFFLPSDIRSVFNQRSPRSSSVLPGMPSLWSLMGEEIT